MKKLLIFALALVALVGCNKKHEESEAEKAYYALYAPGCQGGIATNMIRQAQALNFLLNQADDWSDLNNVKDDTYDYKADLFGEADITNDNGVITISYGNLYQGVRGDLIINTGNQLLDVAGTTWEFVEPTSDANKFQISSQTVDSWDSFTISSSGDSWECSLSNMVFKQSGKTDGRWSLHYFLTFSEGVNSNPEKWIGGTVTFEDGSTGSGNPIGISQHFDYRIDQDMVVDNTSFVAMYGKETVTSTEYAATDPVKFPASSISVVYNVAGQYATCTIHYNGKTWQRY